MSYISSQEAHALAIMQINVNSCEALEMWLDSNSSMTFTPNYA